MFSASGMYPHHIRISCGHTHTAEVDAAIRTVGAIASELASRPAQ
jgi:DNA-binding transcriptional MocR family regulator